MTADDLDGPVVMFIESELNLDGYVESASGQHGFLFMGYMGTAPASIHRSFSGTLVAPRAKINLATDLIGHFGSFFGRDIEVHQDTTVWSHPFEGPWPFTFVAGCSNGTLDSNETDVDCGGVCGSNCEAGQACSAASDCASSVCTSGQCDTPACSEATAVNLGAPGNAVAASGAGCVMVQGQYPVWWGTRPMQLQSSSGSGYPIAIEWSNSCASSGGSAMITSNWQSLNLVTTNDDCATLIDLQGSSTSSVTLRYY